MIRIRYFLLSVLITAVGNAWGATISESQAKEIATTFMAAHSMSSTNLKIAHRAPIMSAAMPTADAAYYVFNTQQAGKGFVIVAGDDRVPAILGYSDSGSFDIDDVPEALQAWLDGYAEQIRAIEDGGSAEVRTITRNAIEPMLPVRWGQGMPYSVLLPHINGSSNAHAYVGCVAVAMAQVMAYWQYPPRPTTTIPGYTSNSGKTYAVTMPSLSPMDFDWEHMQDTYYTSDSMSIESQAVANLMLYSTTAMKSNFGLTSTGSYTRNIPQSLITYFGYKNSAHYIYRESFNTESWENTIYAELVAGRPVAYGGNKQSAGHAFVCDGYDGEGRFHINWGWAGKSNGYFLLNLLNPSDEGIGSAAGAYGYVKGQGAAIGLEPADGESGTAAFSFEDLAINSSNNTRSAASSNFSVTVSGKFVNNTNVTSQFRQGWGLYKDGELIDVLFIRYTTSALSNGEYVTVSSRSLSFGAGITSGTYRILPIYSIYPSEDYQPCIGSDVNYIEVTFDGTYSCAIKGYGTAGSTTRYTVNNCNIEGTLNHGKPVTMTLNLKNAGTSTNDLIYMFVDGTFNAMGLANIATGESGDLVFRFTPTTAGTKTVTFSLNESGSSPFYTQRVTINTMPSATLDVSYRIQGIIDEENHIITADSYCIIADITNTGTTAYDEDFSVRLYRINNPDTNVGTELLNQTQPLYLNPGESTSLIFDFDHDLIDGWRYFCYLYYYSNGETESTGTKWYYLHFLNAPDDAYRINTGCTPANGGSITITGGTIGNKAVSGDTVTFIVTPGTGYTIHDVNVTTVDGEPVALSLDNGNGIYSFVMPAANVTIGATFDEIPVYAINLNAAPVAGGAVRVSTPNAVAGETVSITANANVGWQLDAITAQTTSGSPVEVSADNCIEMPEDDVTVTATFSRNTGSLFELVTQRDSITEGSTYVIASQYYHKTMKFHEESETTFGATPVDEWLDSEKTIVRASDNSYFFRMEAVNPDTISHGGTATRTNAFLSSGNGYLTTSSGNLIVSNTCTAQCRAGMFVSSNAYNYLVRFFNEASGASSDFMTVRYDFENSQFRILNYSSNNQQRVWLYKLVPSYAILTVSSPEDGGTINIESGTIGGQAQTDETVTFSVTVADGHELTDVSVTIDGEAVEINETADGTYSFVMPASEVTITATYTETQPEFIPGDVNNDGTVDIDDITMLIGVVLGSTPSTPYIMMAGDMNHDSTIDIDDITALISQVLGN